MKRFNLIALVIFCWNGVVVAQTKDYAIEQIDSLMRIEKKPIIILLSANWCVYCQIQQRQLVRNKEFQKHSENFYFTVFNAERKDILVFNNQLFGKGKSSKHALAIALNGATSLAFPSWVVLDREYRVLFRNAGMLHPKQISSLLNMLNTSP